MVKIAIAGGSGEVAREIIDVLAKTNKHEILVLSRKDANPGEVPDGTTWVKVDYSDKLSLVQALNGVHTVLSFVVVHNDADGAAQKALIDASVDAGVKRFAPSEWSSANVTGAPWYAAKLIIRDYLKELNREKKVLEYCLFYPGVFLDYLATPYRTTNHIVPFPSQFDFANRRALVVDGFDDKVTFTTARDLAEVVARAIEFKGEWPVTGGINGTTVNSAQVVALGEKVTGEPFVTTRLKLEDVKAGEIKSSWLPEPLAHPSIPVEQRAEISKHVLLATLERQTFQAWAVSDEWNKLLPDYKFTGIEEFLAKVWGPGGLHNKSGAAKA